MKDKDLLYGREAKDKLIGMIDDVLIAFAEDLASNPRMIPAEFTNRMQGAMAIARRLKDALKKEDAGDDNG